MWCIAEKGFKTVGNTIVVEKKMNGHEVISEMLKKTYMWASRVTGSEMGRRCRLSSDENRHLSKKCQKCRN